MPWPTTSRHERGYGTTWDKLRLVILRRDAGICQPCLREGRMRVGGIVDHVKPKQKGGSDDEDNLQTICAACHTAKTLEENGKAERATIGIDGWPVEPQR